MSEYSEPKSPEEPYYEGGSLVPVTPSDWRKEAAMLEAKRDKIRPLLEAQGIDPLNDADFAFLLGRLSMVHKQVNGLEFEDTRTALEAIDIQQ